MSELLSPTNPKDATTSDAADAGTGRRTCAGTPKNGEPEAAGRHQPAGSRATTERHGRRATPTRTAALRRLGRRADPDKRARSDSPYRCKGGRPRATGQNSDDAFQPLVVCARHDRRDNRLAPSRAVQVGVVLSHFV